MNPPFRLVEITTKDNLVHQGIFFRPKKPGRKAVLWVHGLTGRFYGDIDFMEAMAVGCEKRGFGFASFNTRGHDMVTGAHRRDPASPTGYTYATIGAGNEKFEDSVFDIEAGVSFLVDAGFRTVVLVGISTGANKACYYGYKEKDARVGGIVLLSPVSDRLSPKARVTWYKKAYLKFLVLVGKGDTLHFGRDFFPGTPRRFLSLITQGSPEDIFDYGEQDPLGRFSTITLPLCLVLGEHDEHADRHVADIKRTFDAHTKSSRYASFVVDGASHGFDGKEKEVAEEICSWVDTL